MKKEYHLAEDLFVMVAIILFALALGLKLFGISFYLGFARVLPTHLLQSGCISLLISIALNLQEIAKK